MLRMDSTLYSCLITLETATGADLPTLRVLPAHQLDDSTIAEYLAPTVAIDDALIGDPALAAQIVDRWVGA